VDGYWISVPSNIHGAGFEEEGDVSAVCTSIGGFELDSADESVVMDGDEQEINILESKKRTRNKDGFLSIFFLVWIIHIIVYCGVNLTKKDKHTALPLLYMSSKPVLFLFKKFEASRVIGILQPGRVWRWIIGEMLLMTNGSMFRR